MGIPEGTLSGINFDPPPLPKETVKQADAPEETAVGYVARKGAEGYGKGVGRNIEAGVMRQFGESLPISALRLFLPGEWVDKISPIANLPMEDKWGNRLQVKDVRPNAQDIGGAIAADVAGKGLNLVGIKSAEGGEIGPATGPINHTLGTMADFVGGAFAQPLGVGGSVAKYGMMAAGAGLGSEVGGSIGEQVDRKVFGGSGKKGEAVGSILGSLGAGYANVVRGNAVVEGLKKPIDTATTMFDVAKKAREQKKAGDARSVWQIFADDYGNLREKSKSVIQEQVNHTVAKDIAMDPDAPASVKAFNDAVDLTGFDPATTNIAQRTSTPSLVGTIVQFRPTTPEDVARLSASYEAPKKELINTAKRITQNTVAPDAESVLSSLKELQKTETLRLNGLAQEADEVAKTTPRLSIHEKDAIGQDMYKAYEAQLAAGREQKNSLYAQRNTIADQQSQTFNLQPVADQAGQVIKDTLAKLDPTTVPESISNIKSLFGKKGTEGLYDTVIQGMAPEMRAEFTRNFPRGDKPVTMEDLGKALSLVNSDISNAMRGTQDMTSRMQAKNLEKVKAALEEVLTTQSSPEVLAAHNTAQEHFRDVFAPRFYEGTNLNLGKDTVTNRPKIDPTQIFTQSGYFNKPVGVKQISETSMKEFDNLFGGVLPGTQKVEGAYNALWKSIENDYSEKVLGALRKDNGFDPSKHTDFLHEYEAALDRVPALRDKLDTNATKLFDLQAEAERVREQYKTITGSELTKQLGSDVANKVLTDAIADPRKMGQLLGAINKGESSKTAEGSKAVVKEIFMRATPWKEVAGGRLDLDPQKLFKLVNAGTGPNGEPGGLQVAMRAAYGRKEGDAHLERLRALALIADRIETTNPRYLRPQELVSDDPVKQATGSGAASWIAMYKNAAEGRASTAYVGTVGLSRFFNARLKQAFSEATQKALFDADMSKAILEMSTTKADAPISLNAAKTVFGPMGEEGSAFIKRLIEHGQVKKHLVNSGRLGVTQEANDDDESASKRERSYTEPYINRMK
jgi:hypothetical protein